MSNITFFFIFIPLLALILLAINLIFAPHNPYQEKNSAFECGFTSFQGQNRTQFSISFFIFALLFLLFDLEILLVYPYLVSSYSNEIYGLFILLIFLGALTLGFAFELGKKALSIDSKQTQTQTRTQDINHNSSVISVFTNKLFFDSFKRPKVNNPRKFKNRRNTMDTLMDTATTLDSSFGVDNTGYMFFVFGVCWCIGLCLGGLYYSGTLDVNHLPSDP